MKRLWLITPTQRIKASRRLLENEGNRFVSLMKSVMIIILIITTKLFPQICETEIPEIYFDDKTRLIYENKLTEAKLNFSKDASPDNLIWLGRRLAYLGKYDEAIEIYSKGIIKYPKDARFYRHRGHRYISSRCFELAIKDFKKAASITRNKPNKVEPDGLPNSLNIPTSTLQGNIYYHLGLTYYIQGNYNQARRAYEKTLTLAENPDSYVAAANWLYIINRHLGRNVKAEDLLETITDDMAIIENHTYFEILKLYKGQNDPIEIKKQIMTGQSLVNATMAFGLGNYYFLQGREKEATEMFRFVVDGNQWSSFGYICAEARLNK